MLDDESYFDIRQFGPEYEYDLLPGYKFPWMPVILVRKNLVEIRDSDFTDDFKNRYIEGVAYIFQEENLYSIQSQGSKIINAKEVLEKILSDMNEHDRAVDKGFGIRIINEKILQGFEITVKLES